jgi:transposase
MSLCPEPIGPVPDHTAQIARAAFPRGNPYLRVTDALGPVFRDADFADLYSKEGQPAEAPWRLALVTLFQFAEGLADRQAADAVRGRIDWKSALRLPLDDPGFDASILCEFRGRLLAGNTDRRLFDTLLARLKAHGYVQARGRQRTDSTHVLAAIHVLNRLECVGETLRQALNTLAVVAPAWLRSWVPGVWFDRYGQRLQDYRLPKSKEERTALAEQIGADGCHLLAVLDAPALPDALHGLRQLPAVGILREVWAQQYFLSEPGDTRHSVRWRAAPDLPPAAEMISSPYDPDARYSIKWDTEWTGYRVHLTETCDEDTPNLITDVATAPAPTVDHAETAAIQDRLAERGLTPSEHIVDNLCHGRSSGHQPDGARVHAARAHRRRLQLASAGADRLRRGPVRDRLGGPARHLPQRQDERDLEARREQPRARDRLHPVRAHQLRAVSCA